MRLVVDRLSLRQNDPVQQALIRALRNQLVFNGYRHRPYAEAVAMCELLAGATETACTAATGEVQR